MGTYTTYTVSGPEMLPAEFKSFGFDSFDDFGGFGGGDFGGGGGGSYTIKTIRTTKGDGDPKVTRYSRGWRSTEQDHKIQTRVQKIEAQDFKGIRDECLEKGVLFEDPDFPANDKSVYYSTTMPQSFQWKRPTELVSDPRMFVGGASRFDVQQGDLGNCWFLASVASLCASGNRAVSNDLLYRVCPQDNSFVEKYAGVFRFRLWQYGKWVDVVIDDRLPTMNGRLMFMHSATENEFWSALLEKAYAKINGSYEALSGGCSSEAMEDLTGGVVETFNFTKEIPDNMWSILTKAHNRRSLMAAQIDCQSAALESVMDNGLIIGHAYSITAIRQLHIRGHEVNLLRIRNPWGNQYEWKGSWSDQSREWSMVSESERQAMGLHFESDGEFWMSFEDFKSNFTKLEICNLSPDSLEGDELKKHTWEMTLNDGTWRANVNAGGCRNFLNTFWTNPQYRTEVVDPDEDDDENMGTIIVALMQKERRKKKSQGLDYLTIGFSIYALKDPKTGPLDLNFFKYNAAAKRSTFSNVREMSGRFKVPPGHYVIIPTTFKAGEEGDFLLRIFSEKPMKSEEIDEATGIMQQTDEKSIEDMEKGGVITGIDAKKRRLRSMQVTEDDVNQERDARSIFRRTSGEDMEVDAFELRSILDSQFMKEFRFDGFGIETCRSMVALLDLDKSGKLGFEEFKKLWVGLRQWKKIFREFDDNNSGTLSAYQLRQALNSAGIQVSNMTFNALAMRYADKNGAIHFNDFIHCAVRIRTMLDTFIQMARGTPNASFDLDQFIQTTLYS